MDKNTIIGMILIAVVIFGFSILNRPKPRSNTDQPRTEVVAEKMEQPEIVTDSVAPNVASGALFANNVATASQQIVLQNDRLAVTFDTKGGVPVRAELKEFKTYDSKPLYLFDGDALLNIFFRTVEGRISESKDLTFQPVAVSDSTLTLRLSADSAAYIDLRYRLRKDDYMLDLTLAGNHTERIFPGNLSFLDFEMAQKMPRQEKSWQNENNYTGIYYKFSDSDVERLRETKQQSDKSVADRLHWIAFKDKFFATALIAGDAAHYFEHSALSQKTLPKDGMYTKEVSLASSFPFTAREGSLATFMLYMGPLEHHLLKDYDQDVKAADKLHLERLVYVGGSLFRWINLYLIIPVVDFLSGFVSNWGIIILLLTLIIKLALSPLTFKSYMSQAKMRVLKPQVEAINKKYAGDDQAMMLKRSRETMALYKAAGANPMSGCLPMLFQMPFLIALYMFFPTAIALRGESFLWVKDLSSYDAILSWNFNIPILTGLMGNHISLFCLLWAVTNILYSRYTMSQSATGQSNQQMKMMKWMPYIMSIMFFFFFNNNASGLCYYYFISTLITIIQFVVSRMMINEEKVLARIEENKKKPKKKSGFAARLEEAQRKQMQLMREQQKKQGGRR